MTWERSWACRFHITMHPLQQPSEWRSCWSYWFCMPPAMPPPWGILGRPADSSYGRMVRLDRKRRTEGGERDWKLETSESRDGDLRLRETDLVVLPDFAHELTKRLVDVDSLLCGRLDEAAAKVFCQVAALYRMTKRGLVGKTSV